VRGFGHVKEKAIAKMRTEREELLQAFDQVERLREVA